MIDAAKALIKNNQLTTEALMKYIKGPDFPTGGIIVNQGMICRRSMKADGEDPPARKG